MKTRNQLKTAMADTRRTLLPALRVGEAFRDALEHDIPPGYTISDHMRELLMGGSEAHTESYIVVSRDMDGLAELWDAHEEADKPTLHEFGQFVDGVLIEDDRRVEFLLESLGIVLENGQCAAYRVTATEVEA